MKYDPKTYFAENEYDDVKGFTVLAADDGEYHIAEKWLASQDDESSKSEDSWIDYWITESDLLARVEDELCEEKAKLTDEQFEKVCQKVDWTEYVESQEVAA